MTASSPTKAIVIAAGRGRRLGPHTAEIPKCLVPVGRRSILGWVVSAFAGAGITDLVMIRGYLPEVLAEGARALHPGVRFVENADWQTNNILLSLAKARHELDGPVVITYSDIVFTPPVMQALAAAEGDVCLVIDRDFRSIYQGRTEHPLEEGEVSDLDASGNVKRVGKKALPPAEAFGEFIGLLKLSAEGARWFREAIDELTLRYAGREEEPFQRAAQFRNAYLTDLLQHLIDAGRPVTPVAIDGNWREIDTGQDLERAIALVESGSEEWT
jgi:L-glutamine-phosphate cytidylyltransferase